MAIDFPSPALHGSTYDYNGIRYTFDDGNAGGGAGPGEGWWFIGTVGSFGSCTGAEIDAGVESVKYATPLAIEESSMVKESPDGATRLTYLGSVVAQTTATGFSVPGTLSTNNLALLGDLTIPGTLFSGGIENGSSVKVIVSGTANAGLNAKNDNGGFELSVDLSDNIALTSFDAAGANPQPVLQYVRSGSAVLSYNGIAKLTTTFEGLSLVGDVTVSGGLSATLLSLSDFATSSKGFIADSGSAISVESQWNTSDGEAVLKKDGTSLTLTVKGPAGANQRTAFTVNHLGAFSLYYDGVSKLTTASGGVNVVGNLSTGTATGTGNFTISSGANPSAFIAYGNNGGGYVGVSAGNLELGSTNNGDTVRTKALTSTKGAETKIYHNGSAVLETTPTGIKLGSGLFLNTDGKVSNSDNSFILSADGDLRTTKAIHNNFATLASDGTIISNNGQCRILATSNVTANHVVGNTAARTAMRCDSSSGLASFQRTNSVGTVTNSGLTLASDGNSRLYYAVNNLRLNTSSSGGKTTGTWTNVAISDPSVKKDIMLRSGIDNILALNGVDWNWKDPDKHFSGAPKSGFLADNWQDIYPNQVSVKGCLIKEYIVDHAYLLTQEPEEGEEKVTREELQRMAEEACSESDNDHVGKLQISSDVSDKTFDADLVESIKFLHNELMNLKEEVADLTERNSVLEGEVLGLGL